MSEPPPVSEAFGIIETSGDPIRFDCGHEAPACFTIEMYGEHLVIDYGEKKDRPCCGPCAIERLRSTVIRCALCGHAILPREPVAAYIKMPWMNDAWCTVVDDEDGMPTVAGCYDYHCKPEGTYQYGFWTGKSFQTNVTSMISFIKKEGDRTVFVSGA